MDESQMILNNLGLYKNISLVIQNTINNIFTECGMSNAMPFSGGDWIITRTYQTNLICIYCIKSNNNFEVSLYMCCVKIYNTQHNLSDVYNIIQNGFPSITVINYVDRHYKQIGKAKYNIYVRKYEDITEYQHAKIKKFYDDNCKDFGIISFKPDTMGDTGFFFFITDNSNNFKAVSYIKYNDIENIAELYSSCTAKDSRGKGLMRTNIQNLLGYLLKIKPKLKRVWAGIDVNHSSFIQEANRKIKLGFGHSLSIDSVTPLGNTHQPFRFLSMWWEPSLAIISSEMMNNAKIKIDMLKKRYDFSLYISISDAIVLNNLREEYPTHEVAGKFTTNKRNHNLVPHGLIKTIPTGPPTSEGTMCFTGNFGQSTILSFHTHPEGCYIDNEVDIGWPSAEDWLWIFKTCFNSTFFHTVQIVITREGIYSMRLSKQIANMFRNNNMTILDKLKNAKVEVSNFIFGKIADTYINRTNKKTKNQITQAIVDNMSYVNNLNIYDVRLFNMSFWAKENQNQDISFEMY